MITSQNGTRYKNYILWETHKNLPYNYERDGLLNKTMSHKITETQNTTLQNVLKFVEGSMVFLMQYVDELKNFKNYNWKNR